MCLIYCSGSFAKLIHPGQNSAHSSIYKSGDVFDTFGCKTSYENERLFHVCSFSFTMFFSEFRVHSFAELYQGVCSFQSSVNLEFSIFGTHKCCQKVTYIHMIFSS